MKIIIITLSLLTALQSFASCGRPGSAVDLRKSHPEIMGSLSIQDQGSVGYCYAYAGKFLYDFNRYIKVLHNKNLPHDSLGSTSPTWSAALGMKEGTQFSDEGGFTCNVVNGLSTMDRNCLNSSLTNESFHELGPQIYRLLFDRDNLMVSYQGKANLLWRKFAELTEHDFSHSTHLTGEKLKIREGFYNFQRKVRNVLAGRNIPASLADSAYHYYNLVRVNHLNSTYLKLPSAFALSIAKLSCTSWKAAVKSTCKDEPAYNLDTVNVELSHGRPVGISYCSKILTDKSYRGFPQSGNGVDCGMHASVLIGRKVDSSGKCQYLVRNSWGTNKTNYDWKTDKGDIWVDSDALNDNLREFQTVH